LSAWQVTMCTVLQQHLNRLTNGYDNDSAHGETTGTTRSGTPSTAIYHHHHRPSSPTRLSMQPTYSYLQDPSSLKRPGNETKESTAIITLIKMFNLHSWCLWPENFCSCTSVPLPHSSWLWGIQDFFQESINLHATTLWEKGEAWNLI